MIAYLEGIIRAVSLDNCVVQVGGVGYRVNFMGCNPQVGEQVCWEIYDHVREDRHELFGAPDKHAIDLFEKLIDINGVGPRLAQKILLSAGPAQVHDRILNEDLAFLTSISGVGKKTAQKIILELKGVLVREEDQTVGDVSTIEALVSLGYSRREAIEVAKGLPGETVEERIKQALKQFSHGS
ncbi:Holliday junction branch migration protein RuvA [Patescibacteria group bacterium]|nr:Holliday junction branch migration protein RuvA [Patescibacteria group bacterium]MBU4453274.1 Holliday junction branch migration protein RuvA [Patescibacteria group bacterium]MCG2687400.1 Holliday junction branch migration protein RuvA [Candidatus Parcubacteria bacterium]